MPIKIARIVTRMDLGGAQQAVLALAQGLDSDQFEQIVITGNGGLLLHELDRLATIRHYLVPELNRHVGLRGLLKDLRALLKIRKILRAERPLIAHTHTPKAGIVGRWAAWLAGVPIILHSYHGFGFGDSHPRWLRACYVSIERVTAFITTRFVAVSVRNRTKGARLGIFRIEDCAVIRSGVCLSRFQPQDLDKVQKKLELGLAGSDMVVGIIASFTPAKGLPIFLDVAAKVLAVKSDTRFLMVGDGVLRPALQAQARKLHVEHAVQMLGWRHDIPELLHIIDILLLTSLWEGVPRVLVEASASGVPVVASDVDGVAEVVADGLNGVLVAPGDVNAFARAVLELIQDDSRRLAMRNATPVNLSEFSVESMLERHSRLYLDLGAGRHFQKTFS